MSNLAELLERESRTVDLEPGDFERLTRRRDRRQRNRRIGSAVVALVVAGATIGGLLRALSSDTVPANDPRDAFLGTWIATDVDGSTSTMAIRASGEQAEIEVHDDRASACSGAPSTMIGTGQLRSLTELVIPSPTLTCDDGSEPQALGGPSLEEQLRNLTFVHHPETDTLTDNFEVAWERSGPSRSGGMWPQTSPEEVQEAQRLADAGDPRYTWQVDPELEATGDPGRRFGQSSDDAEIVARFLREELGWEEFLFYPDLGWDPAFSNFTYLRCAPGGTNPLYPDDSFGGGCAPTIDELRYETVQIDLAQPGRRGPSGIWVVTGWEMISPFSQLVPPSEAETTALLEAFLQARIEGEGAEEYVDVPGGTQGKSPTGEVPLPYATTTGAPYERSEFERVDGPRWPFGDETELKVRLFAEGGATVVEQLFFMNHDAAGLDYLPGDTGDIAPTTENGQPVAEPYSFLDGEVTFHAAWPWGYSFAGWQYGPGMTTLLLNDRNDQTLEQRLVLLADPRPVESGCQQGPAPANAEALAQSIGSDPDFEATAPKAVSVGGTPALRMDVVLAPGASVCDTLGSPQVLTPDDQDSRGVGLKRGHRMRLYLLDLPEGLSARILAIAIVAPESSFDRVMEAAAPIVGSFEFRIG